MRSPFPAVRLGLAVSVGLGLGLSPAVSTADEPLRIAAKVDCPRVAAPGRVRCEIEVRARPGLVLKWADAVVSKSPPFATPLRARVGPADATAHEETVWRWAIAFAARTRDAGEVVVRVRLVACEKDACTPEELEARGQMTVGE